MRNPERLRPSPPSSAAGALNTVEMEDIWRPSVALLVLPAIHLAMCVYIQLSPCAGGWWFPAFLVDLPFSILLMFAGRHRAVATYCFRFVGDSLVVSHRRGRQVCFLSETQRKVGYPR
jgi:hypothetical protein